MSCHIIALVFVFVFVFVYLISIWSSAYRSKTLYSTAQHIIINVTARGIIWLQFQDCLLWLDLEPTIEQPAKSTGCSLSRLWHQHQWNLLMKLGMGARVWVGFELQWPTLNANIRAFWCSSRWWSVGNLIIIGECAIDESSDWIWSRACWVVPSIGRMIMRWRSLQARSHSTTLAGDWPQLDSRRPLGIGCWHSWVAAKWADYTVACSLLPVAYGMHSQL